LPETEARARRRNRRRRGNLTADQVVADQIRALRDRRGKSQQELADALGWTQSIVARIESGGRTISVSELLQISWALDVAPVHLLAASFRPQEVPVYETVRLAPSDARAWIRGETPIPGGNARSYYENVSDEEWDERMEIWASVKGLTSRREAIENLLGHVEAAERIFETGDWEDPSVSVVEPEKAKRRKDQYEASKRARKRGDGE
jgi:transcriptional regulator with XRE-family HTH domain